MKFFLHYLVVIAIDNEQFGISWHLAVIVQFGTIHRASARGTEQEAFGLRDAVLFVLHGQVGSGSSAIRVPQHDQWAIDGADMIASFEGF